MSLRPLPSICSLLLVMSAVASPIHIESGHPASVVGTESPAAIGPVDDSRLPAPQRASVAWAVGLFDEAELDLPALRFEFWPDDRSKCQSREGFHLADDRGSTIRICTAKMTRPVKIMILHEVAHAWAAHSLSTERKEAFQELRGWEHWRSYGDAAWHENGTEQAAEILVWGLMDRPLRMARIDQNGCDELEAGYRTLTGEPPLHGFRDLCDT